jgi:DNA-binding response OmpR family regulator
MSEVLELSGIYVDGVASAMEFYQLLHIVRYDVAIIDIGLPDQSGYEIAEFLREKTSLGIIILTAKGELEDRVKGYESGADHFFVKPVDHLELVAAIKSLHGRVSGNLPDVSQALECWRLNMSSWQLASPDGMALKLTAKEIEFLEKLIEQPDATISRQMVIEELGYPTDDYGNRSLDAMVRRLRKKVFEEFNMDLPLQTVHGVGYCFSASAIILRSN